MKYWPTEAEDLNLKKTKVYAGLVLVALFVISLLSWQIARPYHQRVSSKPSVPFKTPVKLSQTQAYRWKSANRAFAQVPLDRAFVLYLKNIKDAEDSK